MDKFSVDLTELQSKLQAKKAYRLSDVKHKIKKVAFDVVKFVDSDRIDDLWQIQRDGDDEYIVAMYDDNVTKTASAPTSQWSALADNAGNNVNVFYRNVPVKRICIASMGIPAEDSYLVCRSITEKLASDKSFLVKFLSELTDSERKSLEDIDPSVLATK